MNTAEPSLGTRAARYRRAGGHGGGRGGLLGPPKTKVCLFYDFVLSPLTLLGMSPTTISLSLSKS